MDERLEPARLEQVSATAAHPARLPRVAPLPTTARSPPYQLRVAFSRVAVTRAAVFTVRYFYWRVAHTMNPAAKWFFYHFLVAEMLNFLESTFFYFVAWSPTAYRNPPLLPGRTVDVFITTYNEPLDLLRETVVVRLRLLETCCLSPPLPRTACGRAIRLSINSPQTGNIVQGEGILASVEGTTHGTSGRSRIHIEVATNRWYSQPGVTLRPDGSFSASVYLGGEGAEMSSHDLRAAL